MTKFRFFVKLVLASVLTFSVTSCDKDEDPSSLTVDLLKKGTIQGYVFAELDLTKEGYEHAPAGTELILTVDYSSLGSTADGYWSDTVKVGDDGTFTAQVPVTTEGAYVRITPLPYSYDQVQAYGSYYETVTKLYTYSGTSVTLKANELKVVQISYSDEDFDNFVDVIELSGTLFADLDAETSDYENCASGINLTFYDYSDEWSKTVTTGDNGSFTVVLPKGYVYVDCEFIAQRLVNDGSGTYTGVSYTYTIDSRMLGPFYDSESDYELDVYDAEETK